ncbi:MAG: hypothetical protein VCA55_13605 [Verrucomicrobiales bacterium]
MRSIRLIAVFLTIGNTWGQDIVHIQRGGALHGKILELNEIQLRIRIPLAGGAGSSTRTLAMEQVRMIDFGPIEGELQLLAAGEKAPREELADLWDRERGYLGLPNSNAGDIGIQLAGIFLAAGDRIDHVKARNLYAIIEKEDWHLKRRSLAKRGRLNALVKLGDAEEVIAEAKIIAAEDDDPGLLLDARHVITLAEFDRFSGLVANNPKWIDDDVIRGEVEERYNKLIDRFLEPFLFYGTESVAAARGLWHAAKTYELIGQESRAVECLTDIEKLYPQASSEYPLAAMLGKLSTEK